MSCCKREFQWSNCGLNHSPANNFIKSKWQSRTRSKTYLCYRWLLGLYFLAAVCFSVASSGGHFGKYFIYLTNWGMLLCTITTLYGAILITLWYCHPSYHGKSEQIEEMPRSFMIFWSLHSISLVISICITLMYWGLLFDPQTHSLDAVNVMTHASNSVLMFLDMLIVSHPIRLLHVIQPILFGIIYSAFSVVYYFAGGTNAKDEKYIYNVLDWSKPGSAIVTVVMTVVLAVIIQVVLFVICWIRNAIYSRYFFKEEFIPTTSTTSVLPLTNISMVFGHDNCAIDISSEEAATEKKIKEVVSH